MIERFKRSALTRVARSCADIASSVVSLVRLAHDFSPQRCRIPTRLGERLVILGAGPSLRQTLGQVKPSFASDIVFLSVNDLYRDESFCTLRPAFHVIADPIYWDDDTYGEYAEPLSRALRAAEWSITLFMPLRAKKSRLHDALTGSNVHVAFYRTTPIKGLPTLEYLIFRARLGIPKTQNVLVAALAIALWMNFRSIALIGADHTWHRDLSLNQQNVLMTGEFHSYGSGSQRPFLKPSGVGKSLARRTLGSADVFTMREIFLAWATVHESYEKLARIARRQDARITNCSAVTFIDAFERTEFAGFIADSAGHNQCSR